MCILFGFFFLYDDFILVNELLYLFSFFFILVLFNWLRVLSEVYILKN